MNKITKNLLTGISLLCGSLPSLSYAGGVNIQTFQKATGSTYETTESAFLEKDSFGVREKEEELSLIAHYNYADNPLVEYNPLTGTRTHVIVDGIHTLNLAAELQTKKWAASIILPIHSVRLEGEDYRPAMGDLKVQSKFEISRSEDQKRALILVPALYFPTGNPDLFVSNGSFGAGIKAAVEQDFGLVRAAASLGFTSFGNGVYREIDYRFQLPYSLAVSYLLTEKVALNGEFFQAISIPRNALENPGELYIGTKLKLPNQMTGSAGVSFGQTDFLKANDMRIHLGLQFQIDPPKGWLN